MNAYLRDLLERVTSTFAATLGAVWAAGPLNILESDWKTALSVSASAALLSLLKGVVARGTGPTDGAGLGT